MTDQIPLGQATTYPDRYAPDLLYAIARTDSREALGIGAALPFGGVDVWNAWELTWLNADGVPQVAVAQLQVPATAPNIVESKSLKLYLNSFAMDAHSTAESLRAVIKRDLSACVNDDVDVTLRFADDPFTIDVLPGTCIDQEPARCDNYAVDANSLRAGHAVVNESLHSHLLRSLCPVTGQPDIGSIVISYAGPRIDPEGLLHYIVSYRNHSDFHEACVERMFLDIKARCNPDKLSVHALYQRRGGIDINPFRSNTAEPPPNLRLWRQ